MRGAGTPDAPQAQQPRDHRGSLHGSMERAEMEVRSHGPEPTNPAHLRQGPRYDPGGLVGLLQAEGAENSELGWLGPFWVLPALHPVFHPAPPQPGPGG